MAADDSVDCAVFSWPGECVGCDAFAEVEASGLCSECAAKLDRDLIRQRDWDYSVSAYGVPPGKREVLRDRVIERYGAALELIAGPESSRPKRPRKRRRRKQRPRRPDAV